MAGARPSSAASPRRQLNARQSETVERLLAAALAELAEAGHEALTIRTVAQRAGVSPATAYTYFASKNHLYAEVFLRAITERPDPSLSGTPLVRVQAVTRDMADFLADQPELAAAVRIALLGTDDDVARLRIEIGTEFLRRFAAALGEGADPVLVEALVLAFSGALLQAGMGLLTYAAMGDRLHDVVAVVMAGHLGTEVDG